MEIIPVDGHAVESQDVVIAKRAVDTLSRHYPHWPWSVHVNSEDGLLNIFNLAVSNRYGYVLYLDQLDCDMKCVMRAGGEILERAALARRAREEGQVAVYVEGVKKFHQPIKGMPV